MINHQRSNQQRHRPPTDHAQRQLAFYAWCGITHIDLACRYPSGAWRNYYQRPLNNDSITDLRAINYHRHADIYIRPTRNHRSPLLFLDDLPLSRLAALLARHPGLAIRTSGAGGCHLWLRLAKPLAIATRAVLQRQYAAQHDADPASTSGDHYGRLAGTRNHKRGGTWITCLTDKRTGHPIDTTHSPEPLHDSTSSHRNHEREPSHTRHARQTAHINDNTTALRKTSIVNDTSPSAREWGWVCTAIEDGLPLPFIRTTLYQQAHQRRGHDTQRYVDHTISNAYRHCANQHRHNQHRHTP